MFNFESSDFPSLSDGLAQNTGSNQSAVVDMPRHGRQADVLARQIDAMSSNRRNDYEARPTQTGDNMQNTGITAESIPAEPSIPTGPRAFREVRALRKGARNGPISSTVINSRKASKPPYRTPGPVDRAVPVVQLGRHDDGSIVNQPEVNKEYNRQLVERQQAVAQALIQPLQVAPRSRKYSQAQCLRCTQIGHLAKDCPNPEAPEDMRQRLRLQLKLPLLCFNCKKFGHIAHDCPNPEMPREHGGQACFLCAQAGHVAKDCPQQKCFFCGLKGHMARECPAKRRAYRSQTGTKAPSLVGHGGYATVETTTVSHDAPTPAKPQVTHDADDYNYTMRRFLEAQEEWDGEEQIEEKQTRLAYEGTAPAYGAPVNTPAYNAGPSPHVSGFNHPQPGAHNETQTYSRSRVYPAGYPTPAFYTHGPDYVNAPYNQQNTAPYGVPSTMNPAFWPFTAPAVPDARMMGAPGYAESFHYNSFGGVRAGLDQPVSTPQPPRQSQPPRHGTRDIHRFDTEGEDE